MSRFSLNYIFEIDLEITMACLELRIGKIFTIFDISSHDLALNMF